MSLIWVVGQIIARAQPVGQFLSVHQIVFADRSSTIIAIRHRLAMIGKADVVYMPEDGRIVEQGTHKELVALRGRYFRMFESQPAGAEAGDVSAE